MNVYKNQNNQPKNLTNEEIYCINYKNPNNKKTNLEKIE